MVHYLKIKNNLNDDELKKIDLDLYKKEIYAVLIEILNIAITRKYNNINISLAFSMATKSYLIKNYNDLNLESICEKYNIAFGSNHSDGILEMTFLFSARVANNKFNNDIINMFNEMFRQFFLSVWKDLEKINLID